MGPERRGTVARQGRRPGCRPHPPSSHLATVSSLSQAYSNPNRNPSSYTLYSRQHLLSCPRGPEGGTHTPPRSSKFEMNETVRPRSSASSCASDLFHFIRPAEASHSRTQRADHCDNLTKRSSKTRFATYLPKRSSKTRFATYRKNGHARQVLYLRRCETDPQ